MKFPSPSNHLWRMSCCSYFSGSRLWSTLGRFSEIFPSLISTKVELYENAPHPKIQQTKMLVMCQRFGDWFLFGLVWQYSSIQKNMIKVGAKSWMLTCSCHITLSLPFYTDPDSKRELNFCNGYLSLLYFCIWIINNILKVWKKK